MSEALFNDPAVLKVIRAILVSRGVRGEQDLEDASSQVVLKCIEQVRRTGRPPSAVAEAIAIARPIALAQGVGEARKRTQRGRSNVGPTENADEHAHERPRSLDPIDQERMLSAIRPVLKDDQIEELADVGAGVRHAELAAEGKRSPLATRARVLRSREKALGALRAKGYVIAGGFAALLAGSVAVYLGPSRDSGGESHGDEDRLRRLAAEVRRQAADACKEQDWTECENALDRAARLDEQGDNAAEVLELRAAIAAGRRDGVFEAPDATRSNPDAGAGERRRAP